MARLMAHQQRERQKHMELGGFSITSSAHAGTPKKPVFTLAKTGIRISFGIAQVGFR